MRRTQDYFLRTVPTSADLSAPVAELLRHHPTLCPRKIIVAPSQEYSVVHSYRLFTIRYGQRVTPERTLVFGDDHLLVIEKQPDSTYDEIIIPFRNLVHVELAVILLYGYVRFTWIADNTLQTLKIEYNGVGDLMIRAEVERLRMKLQCPDGSAVVLPPTDWAALVRAFPMKFGSYLRYTLFAGEPVLHLTYQPAIDRSRRSRVSGGRLLALTPEWMIVIEEAEEFLEYGMRMRYFPLSAIRRIRFEPARDRVWLRLSFGAEETAMPLSSSNATHLCEALQQITPAIPIQWMSEATPSLVGVTG